MKNLLILGVSLLLTGCGVTYDCERESRCVSNGEALSLLDGRDATLTIYGDTCYAGRVTDISEDSVELQQKDPPATVRIAVCRLRSASVHKSNVGPTFLWGFFGSPSGRPDGRIDISFGTHGSVVLIEQKGLVISFTPEEKTLQLISSNGGNRSGGPSEKNSGKASRGGNHR